MTVDVRPNVLAPVDDPYLWLEEIEGRAALEWIDQQNTRTLTRFGDDEWRSDSTLLTKLLDGPEKIPYIRRHGELLFNFWQDAANPRGIWRTTTLESYCSERPKWSVLFDMDEFAREEGKDWVWGGASVLQGSHDRAILRLSIGGSDSVELREFDLSRRSFRPNGFVLPTAKGDVEWLDQDTLLVTSAFGEGKATQSGYARTIRLWQRGTAVDRLPVICEVPEQYMVVWADVVPNRDPETVWFVALPSFFYHQKRLGDRK
jgi:prolyl oligopeptidase